MIIAASEPWNEIKFTRETRGLKKEKLLTRKMIDDDASLLKFCEFSIQNSLRKHEEQTIPIFGKGNV